MRMMNVKMLRPLLVWVVILCGTLVETAMPEHLLRSRGMSLATTGKTIVEIH